MLSGPNEAWRRLPENVGLSFIVAPGGKSGYFKHPSHHPSLWLLFISSFARFACPVPVRKKIVSTYF
jgi:hypothetical protein